jgi:tape measure domain-containing protein
MSQYNVSLRISYDGKAVSTGAASNAADLDKLKQATSEQGAASVATAGKNASLTASQKAVDASAKETSAAENKLSTDINQQGAAAVKAAQSSNQLKTSYESLNQSTARARVQQTQLATSNNTATAAAKRNTVANYEQGRAAVSTAGNNSLLASSYRALAAGISLYMAAQAGLRVVQNVSAAEQLSIRIKNLTTSFEENAEVQEYLEKTAYRLNVRYSTLADGYGKFLALQKAGVQTTDESRSLLEGLTNAAKELGASNTSVAQTIYGYSQAATQGIVQTTELMQVTEPLPGLLNNMDKAANLAAGGFKKLTGEGQVTSAFFKEVLIKALGEYEGAAESTANTISAAGQNFLTTYDIISKKLEQPVNAAVVPVINTAKDALVLLGDNVDVLGDVADGATLLAAVFAGKLVGSITATTAAYVKERIAAQAKLVTDRQLAASTLAAAKTQAGYAVQLQLAAQRQLAAAQTDYARSAAITNLALRNGQAIAAQNALTAATASYTVAARAASVSARALSGAMTFLGGPIGIITTAAIAVAYFGTSANDAEAPTEGLTQKVKDLSDGYTELTQAQLKLRGVRVDEQLDSLVAPINLAKYKLAELRQELAKGNTVRIDNFGNTMQIPLTQEEIKANNKQIIEQEAALETLEQSKNTLLLTQEQIKKRIASGAASETKTVINPNVTAVDYPKELAKLEESLQTQEERIRASYQKRQAILDGALGNDVNQKAKYNQLSLQLELQRDTDLLEIQRDTQQKRLEREREAEEARLRNLQVSYENELAVIQGFEDRKALLQYQSDKQIADAKNQQQILYAQGFKSQSEKDEHSRQEALLNAQTSRTGDMQRLLFSRAEWERKNEFEKTESVIEIGEFGLKAAAGQSKKAFLAYKAFSIAKAVMNTYEMATGAYTALASIPIVGPALGAAAAVAAVAYGLNQVQTIRAQQYTAAYHGGRDYIPEEQTALLQKGERVVSPKQNVALTAAADKINKGDVAASGMNIYYSPTITVEGGDDASFAKASQLEQQMYERFENKLVSKLRTGTGNFYRSVKAA